MSEYIDNPGPLRSIACLDEYRTGGVALCSSDAAAVRAMIYTAYLEGRNSVYEEQKRSRV